LENQNATTSIAWRHFLSGRSKLLSEYDRARTHSRELQVQTHHGVVAEAGVRDWLASFLPKRFGVVPGYIKSQDPQSEMSSHFDVLIFDQLESPVLWVESNQDKAHGGLSRVIPAEYVLGVMEVKAAFSKRAVQEAIKKLNELTPLMTGQNPSNDPYPTFLPSSTVLTMLFFELRSADAK
jgi:hypothetical protein